MRDLHAIEVDVRETYHEMLSHVGGKDDQARLVAGSLTVAVFLQKTALMLETMLDHRSEGMRKRQRAHHEARNERLKLVP